MPKAATLSSIADAVITTDRGGKVAFMNPVAESLTGWSGAKAAGRPLADVYVTRNEQTGRPEPCPSIAALKDGRVTSMDHDVLLVARDGATTPVSASMSPIPDDKGKIVAAVLVFRDMTERRRVEEQLRQSQKMKTVGKLAGGVAHHFNNLLTVIMGNAQLLLNDPLAVSDLPNTVEQILLASRQAAELTSHLLAFAREGKYQVVPVDLHAVISEVASMLAKTSDRRIKIGQDLQASVASTRGDRPQLCNALLNLGLNAREAMPEGGRMTFATRSVACGSDDQTQPSAELRPGQYVEIAVTDTGVGIDEETLAQVFEPFFTTKAAGEGMGMGLASVYGCVQNHDGAVRIDSKPGQGTTVRIYLPAAAEPETDRPAPKQPAKTTAKAKGHILLVDDELPVADLASKVLTKNGYEVSICHDGAEAVSFYKQHHEDIDLVVLDLVMPEMSGQDALAEMKAVNPDVRVLLSSGFSRNDIPGSILNGDVVGFLEKPYGIHQLSRAIKKHLKS